MKRIMMIIIHMKGMFLKKHVLNVGFVKVALKNMQNLMLYIVISINAIVILVDIQNMIKIKMLRVYMKKVCIMGDVHISNV